MYKVVFATAVAFFGVVNGQSIQDALTSDQLTHDALSVILTANVPAGHVFYAERADANNSFVGTPEFVAHRLGYNQQWITQVVGQWVIAYSTEGYNYPNTEWAEHLDASWQHTASFVGIVASSTEQGRHTLKQVAVHTGDAGSANITINGTTLAYTTQLGHLATTR